MNMNLYGHDVSRGIALFNRKDSKSFMFSAVFCMVGVKRPWHYIC